MFEDVCMVCGKLLDTGLYCSDTCQSADRNSSRSPSSPSTSSVFPSPYISNTAAVPDVPPLMFTPQRTSPGTTSSSASSDVTSVFEYDYDDDDSPELLADSKGDRAFHLPPLGTEHDSTGTIRIPNRPNPYSFARRPAPCDNRTLVPIIHLHDLPSYHRHNRTRTRKLSNTSSSSVAPIQSPVPAAHRHTRSHDMHLRVTTPVPIPVPAPPSLARHMYAEQHESGYKPKRMRASLPAYFSHLSLSSHGSRSPPHTHTHVHVHVGGAAGSDGEDEDDVTTPCESRRHARGKSDQVAAAQPRGHYPHASTTTTTTTTASPASNVPQSASWTLSRGRDGADGAPYGRAVPIPGSQEAERDRARSGMRKYDDVDDGRGGEGERRGRSRVVTHRLELMDS